MSLFLRAIKTTDFFFQYNGRVESRILLRLTFNENGSSDIQFIKKFHITCGITFEFIPYNEYEITFAEFIMNRLRAEQPENRGSILSKGKGISCT